VQLQRWLLIFLLGLGLPRLEARPDDARRHAQVAQAALGPGVWSRLIRIENENRTGPYPRIVHAVVFELAGLLWFYTDTDGTQSFSLHRGRLAEEEQDFGPLLRAIDPGFVRWTIVPDAPGSVSAATEELPNGCFLESVAALRRLVDAGVSVNQPMLLSYYADPSRRKAGHTVLAYETQGRLELIDPAQPKTRETFSLALRADPLRLARAAAGDFVVKARYLPLELPRASQLYSQVAKDRDAPPAHSGRS
jgi:hypothetical protein